MMDEGAHEAVSLHRRLMRAMLVTTLLALTLTGVVLHHLFAEHVMEQSQRMLAGQLEQVLTQLEFDPQGRPLIAEGRLGNPRWQQVFSGEYWQVEAADAGSAAAAPEPLRSRSLWDFTLQLDAPQQEKDGLGQYRIHGPQSRPLQALARTVTADFADGGRWRVVVAADVSETLQAIERFSGLLAASLGVLFVLLLAASIAQVRIGLRPLARLRRALDDVLDGQASQVRGQFAQEVQPLVTQFNTVLARNAEIIYRARTQAGNLAHAIKTPLAVLQQAAQDAETSGAAVPVALINEQVGIARRHVDWHMARSRAAAAAGMPGQRTPLAPVLEQLLRAMRLIHAERALQIALEPAPDAAFAFAGEEQDLQELLGNLIDNACQWARTRVRVGCTVQDEGAARLCVTIDDDGTGIAAEEREQVLARGVRLDESAPGTGLGLSIAQELAGLYHGSVRLDDSPLGGLRVVVCLPLAGAADRR